MDEAIKNGSAFSNESDLKIDGSNDSFDLFAGWEGDASAEVVEDSTTTADEVTTEETETVETEDVAEETPDTSELKFTAKIDHKDQEVTINRDDLPSIYQRAQNQERASARADAASKEAAEYKSTLLQVADLARTMGFEGATDAEVTAAMISGVTESAKKSQVDEMVKKGTARDVAEFIVDQKMKDARQNGKAEAEVTETTVENTDDSGPPSVEQFSKDLDVLFAKRPGLRESNDNLPEEVLDAYMKGENLTVAYLDYESKQNAAVANKTAKTNQVLKQNQASAKKAPVRGVSGNNTAMTADDPMLAGWDEPYW